MSEVETLLTIFNIVTLVGVAILLCTMGSDKSRLETGDYSMPDCMVAHPSEGKGQAFWKQEWFKSMVKKP